MSADIFIPSSRPEDALVGPLHTVTYLTADKNGLERMFCQGMDLSMSSWRAPDNQERVALDPYFGFDSGDTWETSVFYRDGDLRNIQIRAIHVSDDKPMVRPTVDGRYFGGATIGFPMQDMPAREKKMAEAGVPSSVGVKELEFTGANGETYVSREIHFLGMENIFILGVQRPDIFVQVGPVDADTNIGAAAYSCRCVENLDSVNEFFQQVLGHEVRRDMTMTVGPRSGLKLEEGMPERFVQAFAPGSGTGYTVFLEHGGQGIPSPAPTIGSPNRGLVMWSFATRQMDKVFSNAQQAGVDIVYPPALRQSPHLGETRTMLMRDPDGFSIEIFEE